MSGAPLTRISGRGVATARLDWWPEDELPAQTKVTGTPLVASDGAVTRGVLYELQESTTVVALMHPRQDLSRAPQVPHLLRAGLSVWAQNSRDVGNDLQLSHESVLLDIAVGMEHLRALGYERIVLLGISGGAALLTYYAEQSALGADERVAREPSGRPVPLREAPMPSVDGLALVAPHPGQGRLLLGMVDPSVILEGDRWSCDPELDPYAPGNGFAAEETRYAPEFIERYRAAQHARVERIDALARDAVGQALEGRKAWKGSRDEAGRRASVSLPILTTYRTDADLRTVDLSIDPSDRAYGSIMHPRPELGNFGVVGFGRLTTPHAWLSTWSGVSSNAGLTRAAQGVSLPVLIVEYTADQSVYPAGIDDLVAALGSDDVERVRVRADHFGGAVAAEDPDGTSVAMARLAAWNDARA
jgi:pimeloyl-ACP methyl ester carboxylesterase